MALVERPNTKAEELSREEAWALLDATARQQLGMSGDEFVAQWKSGELQECDRPEVMRVAFLINLAA